jgi:hypothetical protein
MQNVLFIENLHPVHLCFPGVIIKRFFYLFKEFYLKYAFILRRENMKNIKLLLLLLLPVLLIGCINYSEETWINDNGSGKISMEISISEQLLEVMAGQSNADPFSPDELTKSFKGVKGIKVGEVKTYHKDGNQIAAVNFEFSSLEALNNIKSGNGTPGFIGKISFAKNKKGQLVFTRTIDKMELGEADSDNALSGQMAAAMFSSYNWKYTIHFPSKVISANTGKENINTKTNTVVWEIPLSAFIQNSQAMTATLAAPNPWFHIIIIVAAILVIAVLALAILKFTKKPAQA